MLAVFDALMVPLEMDFIGVGKNWDMSEKSCISFAVQKNGWSHMCPKRAG